MKNLEFIALLLVINLSPNLTKLKVCREHQHKNFMLTYVSHMRFIGLTWAINPLTTLILQGAVYIDLTTLIQGAVYIDLTTLILQGAVYIDLTTLILQGAVYIESNLSLRVKCRKLLQCYRVNVKTTPILQDGT